MPKTTPEAAAPQLLAVTIWQPWLWAITDLPPDQAKRIENRRWCPYPGMLGRYVCLHASAFYDRLAVWQVARAAGIDPSAVPANPQRGAIVAVARILPTVLRSVVVPSVRWHMPLHFGWQLDDVRKLPQPPACRGWQKVWRVPAEAGRLVLDQLPPEIAAQMATR